MELRNLSARLITINAESGESYEVLPGDNPNTIIPDELAKEGTASGDFIKMLIENGNMKVEETKDAEVETAKSKGKKSETKDTE